jgi:hypothetical protein
MSASGAKGQKFKTPPGQAFLCMKKGDLGRVFRTLIVSLKMKTLFNIYFYEMAGAP